MKKVVMFGMALLLLSGALCAEDAKVMPKRAGRVILAPTFSFAPAAFNTDGDYVSYDGSMKLFNLGAAFEFGALDWLSLAVQWVPGWTVWSDVKPVLPATVAAGVKGDVTVNGPADIFAGAKIQLVGEKAPVGTSLFRLAVAPGVIIPLPGADFAEEAKKLGKTEDIIFSSMDKHVLAGGLRLYFDWIINSNFFINLYNETIFYPVKQDLDKDGPNFFLAKNGIATAMANPTIMNIKGEADYKYRLTFEVEPVFTHPVADGVSVSAGFPVNYRYIPAYEYSFEFPAAIPEAYRSTIKTNLLNQLNTDPQQSLNLVPNVSMFLTRTPLPLEFKFMYGIPVYGKNVMARHNMTLQVRAYFRI